MKGAAIKELMKMRIGDIKEFEKLQLDFQNKCGDIIDREKETVRCYLEQEEIDEDWANKFLEDMNDDN